MNTLDLTDRSAAPPGSRQHFGPVTHVGLRRLPTAALGAALRSAATLRLARASWFGRKTSAEDAAEDDGALATERIRQLKQKPETWVLLIRKARLWQDEPDGSYYRPHLALVVTSGLGGILQSKLLDARSAPTADDALAVLRRAMRHPTPLSGGPRRPGIVQIDDEALVAALTPELAELGVRCVYAACPQSVERIRGRLERQMTGEPPTPGLLSVPGATAPRVRRLFELAAAYYECAPWYYLSDLHPFEIRCPADAPPRYGIVMGSGREVFGLAVYDSARDLDLMFASASSGSIYRQTTWLALIFEEARAMSCDDLDDQERFGWPVAGPTAFPLIGRTTSRGQLTVPTPADLAWLEGALAALVKHFDPDSDEDEVYPVHRTVSVATLDGAREVYLGVPGE